ncbi:MAG: N-acetylmuramoyl-L-alanine amidase [Bacteroidales bacterium]|jgi:N-acetylmuramoyl-L-alanine amidase|nr:N-acetylmuramoyl-L-alanine amidase [Bacteroidales bacterium]
MKGRIIFLWSVLFLLFSLSVLAQETNKMRTVVIDAGHGGHDTGCLGKKSKEKDINLSVALLIGNLITNYLEDVRVIYTRKTDDFVELYKRAQIANTHHADFFISIHCNAAKDHLAHGIETYVMGLHKSEANLEVAKKENSAILKEKNYANNYDGFDPASPEAGVIFSLYSSAYLKNSALLASKVQRNLVRCSGFSDRKVQQAGFWVLYKVAMPSILVELGFLSNIQEENYLVQKDNQKKIATAIYNAFVDYKNQIDGTSYPLLPLPDKKENDLSFQDSIPLTKSKDSAKQTVENMPDIHFRVQFLTHPKELPITSTRFTNISGVMKYYENGLWKYTSGNEPSYKKSVVLLKKIKQYYPDAFIVAWKDGTKISVQEALQLIKE